MRARTGASLEHPDSGVGSLTKDRTTPRARSASRRVCVWRKRVAADRDDIRLCDCHCEDPAAAGDEAIQADGSPRRRGAPPRDDNIVRALDCRHKAAHAGSGGPTFLNSRRRRSRRARGHEPVGQSTTPPRPRTTGGRSPASSLAAPGSPDPRRQKACSSASS